MLDADHFVGAKGWDPDATRLPATAVRAPVLGFDLVRNEFGGWRVLEDNVRSPSGVAYGIALRELMDDVVPDAPRPVHLRDPHGVTDRLRRTLCANTTAVTGATDPVIALVSDGPPPARGSNTAAWPAGPGCASCPDPTWTSVTDAWSTRRRATCSTGCTCGSTATSPH